MVHGLLPLARPENTATTPGSLALDAVLAERAAMWEALAAEQYVGPPAPGARPVSWCEFS